MQSATAISPESKPGNFTVAKVPVRISAFNVSSVVCHLTPIQKMAKRFFDILFSFAVIIFVLSWLVPIVALVIKLTSKGPAFFTQKRSGYLNKQFTCYKLRTMYINSQSDMLQASNDDGRITRLGSFLRKTNIDELPQFWNVLIGDMSVVGPRPHMLKHNTVFGKEIEGYEKRLLVKPGITGLAQVKGWRGPTPRLRDIYKRVQWDIYYVHKVTPLMDCWIIYHTARESAQILFNNLFSK
jgi:putative colanic acid biosynthesis UDP-glucose lipid carrier transferase